MKIIHIFNRKIVLLLLMSLIFKKHYFLSTREAKGVIMDRVYLGIKLRSRIAA